MAHVKADRVQETTTSTGTGALTLAGATAKRIAFSAALADTDTCVCLIEHATAAEWEISLCTFASGAGTLTRSTVYGSTNGGSAVNFSAGTKYVTLVPAATKMIVADNTGATTIPGALLPASDDGGALGSATLNFSDGFFASGAVINFANGNYTITHSSGWLTTSGRIAVVNDVYITGIAPSFRLIESDNSDHYFNVLVDSGIFGLRYDNGFPGPLQIVGSTGAVGIGASPTRRFQIEGNFSLSSWTTTGVNFAVVAGTFTDTTGSGTIGSRAVNSIGTPTLASSSAVTLTDAATLYISAPPTAGTNTTITNGWALWVDSGNVRFDGNLTVNGGIGVGIAASSDYFFRLENTINGGSNVYTVWSAPTFGNNVTGSANNFISFAGTAAAAFTLSDLNHFRASQNTFGAGSSVTTQVGFQVDSSLTGAATNIAFRGQIAKTSGRYNLLMDGTAVNWLRGYAGFGDGMFATTAQVHIGGAVSDTSWTTTGKALAVDAATYTDTSGSGTIGSRVNGSLGIPTFASSSAVTLTDAATLYIAGPPTAGTNTTITNGWALWVDSGHARFDGVVKTLSTTVGSLPAASAALTGARAFVTDANSTTFLATAVGGGANAVPVVCNGSAWVIG